jgi:hypothetical protein
MAGDDPSFPEGGPFSGGVPADNKRKSRFRRVEGGGRQVSALLRGATVASIGSVERLGRLETCHSSSFSSRADRSGWPVRPFLLAKPARGYSRAAGRAKRPRATLRLGGRTPPKRRLARNWGGPPRPVLRLCNTPLGRPVGAPPSAGLSCCEFSFYSVVFVTSLLSLIYGVRYWLPALVVAGLASYDLHSELSASKDADRSRN